MFLFISVTLVGSRPFRGILLQARSMATEQPIGTWDVDSEQFRLTNCSGDTFNSVTHVINVDKTLPRTLYWLAPLTSRENIYFT